MNTWLYYPSTVVFVDDQQHFLNVLERTLPPQVQARFFNNPLEALESIEKEPPVYAHPPLQSIDAEQVDDSLSLNSTYFGWKIDNICKIACDAKRFLECSVVIVDQLMPEMDGISFCRKLKHHSIKKIMLTGNSNQATAIEAFNEGIIDYFLLKDAPDLMQQLTNAIEKMQATYFRTWMERKICEQLKIRFPFPNEHAQVSFYKKWMQIVAANEFYILDNWGSALFIKKDGTPITLVVSPEMLLDFYADVAKDHEEFEIAHSLLRREQLLFFPKERYTLQPVSTWKSFLFTAHPFAEQPGWFYSLIQKEHQQPLSKQEIQTYPKIQRPN